MAAKGKTVSLILYNSPVSQWFFSPSGEQPERRVLAHTLWQPTSDYQYFTNIAAFANIGVLQQIWLYKIILMICQDTPMQVYGACIKDVVPYV